MSPPPPPFRSLPWLGRALILATMIGAVAAVAGGIAYGRELPLDGLLLAVTVALCAAATLFSVLAPGSLTLQLNIVFFAWAVVLLPAWAVPLLAVACFAPGAVLSRARWYIGAFNVANYAIAGAAASAVCRLVVGGADGFTPVDGRGVAALLAAALAIVTINHLLIVGVVHLAQGRRLRQAARESARAVPADLALALGGVCLAAMWSQEPLLAALAIGPLLLMYRAMWVPMLEHKTRTDAKTGLFNFEHFSGALHEALADAAKRSAPLAVVMLDLDHLRAVNNRFGHLAGDRLIVGVARLMRDVIEERGGMAARFGGEEFCLLLPGAPPERARLLAEEIRRRVEDHSWELDEAGHAVRVTLSAGVAAYPQHAGTAEALLEAADAAVYDAKLGGRNRVRVASVGASREAFVAITPAPAREAVTAPAPRPGDEAPAFAHETAPARAGGRATSRPRPLVQALAAGAALAAVVVGVLTASHAALDDPWLFAALVLAVAILDAIRLDVFERGQISPASIPLLTLGAFFGPLGPLFGEALIAVRKLVRRDPLVPVMADFGCLSLAGAAAAGIYAAIPHDSEAMVVVALAAAGMGYYVANIALLGPLVSLAQRVSLTAFVREQYQWLWPHYLAFGALAGVLVVSELRIGLAAVPLFGLPVLMLWVAEKQYLDRSRSSVAELRRSHAELESANESLQSLLDEKQDLLRTVHRSYLSTITSLARTIEAKDPYTGDHTERVATIACAIAAEMGFDEEQLRSVNVGAVVHDIGKIGVPDRVLLKPGGLTDDEFAEIKKHPEISSYILAELDLPAIVKQMVRSHHERFDGKGYPDGLLAEEIPLAARILTAADALDAMTSDRPYRAAMSLEDAVAEIAACSGKQFCPRVVEALDNCLRRDPDFLPEADAGEPREPIAANA